VAYTAIQGGGRGTLAYIIRQSGLFQTTAGTFPTDIQASHCFVQPHSFSPLKLCIIFVSCFVKGTGQPVALQTCKSGPTSLRFLLPQAPFLLCASSPFTLFTCIMHTSLYLAFIKRGSTASTHNTLKSQPAFRKSQLASTKVSGRASRRRG